MILLPDQWHGFYEGVREDKHNTSEKKVPIFVYAADCDSACALKVLQAILGRSDIKYSIHTVVTFSDLRRALLGEIGSDAGEELRTFFCINCGATTGVDDLLEGVSPSVRESLRVVFVDCHRPVHHSFNDVEDSGCVLLLDDDCDVQLADIPAAEAVIQRREDQGPATQRRRVGENGWSQEADGSPNDFRQAWEVQLGEYYSRGSSHGIPSSFNLHTLAHNLHMDSTFLLWMAAVGVTEQLINRRVTNTTPHYVRCVQDIRTFNTQLDSVQNQELYGEGFDSDEDDNGADNVRTSSAAHGVIRDSTEYKLLLHRHWSLYDAMVYSPDIAARLRTFKEGNGGRGTLEVILALTGIPLAQARLVFNQMKTQHKASLAALSDNIVKQSIGGFEMTYESFALDYTNRLTLSAADHVHAISAYLTLEANRGNSLEHMTAGFWNAYSATDIAAHGDVVRTGLERAKDHYRRLLQDCATCDPLSRSNNYDSMVTRDIGDCNVLDLSNHQAWASTSPTAHPVSMRHLAALLQDTLITRDHVSGQGTQAWKLRPFIFIGAPTCTGDCLVVGLQGLQKIRKHPVTKRILPSSHNGVLNIFGSSRGLFRTTVEGMQVNTASDIYFDSAIVRVARDDVTNFMNDLNHAYKQRDQAVWQLEGRIEVDV